MIDSTEQNQQPQTKSTPDRFNFDTNASLYNHPTYCNFERTFKQISAEKKHHPQKGYTYANFRRIADAHHVITRPEKRQTRAELANTPGQLMRNIMMYRPFRIRSSVFRIRIFIIYVEQVVRH